MKKTKEIKANVKNKSKVKKAGKIAASILGASIFLATGATFYENIDNVNLPSRSEIVQTIDDLDASARYISKNDIKTEAMINDFSIRRLIIKNNETVKIKIDNSFSQTKKDEIKFGVDYLNYIFSIINPSYKFEIVENQGFGDLFNENFVRIKEKNSKNLGITYSFALKSFSNFGTKQHGNFIEIYSGAENFETSAIFVHEFMHVLGLGDAYKIKDYDIQSQMMGIGPNSPYSFLSNNDMKLLLALYSDNPSLNDEKFENLQEFKRLFTQKSLKRYKKNLKLQIKKIFESKSISFDENADFESCSDIGEYFDVCGKDNSLISCNKNDNSLKEYEAKYRIENNKKNIFINKNKFVFNQFNDFEKLIDDFQNNDNEFVEYPLTMFKFGDYYIAVSINNLKSLNFIENQTYILKSLTKQEFENRINDLESGNFYDGNLDQQATNATKTPELSF